MSSGRIYKGRAWHAHQDLVELLARIYCKASGAGVDATKSDIPAGFLSVAYTSAGLYTVTLADAFVDLLGFQGGFANDGTASHLDETWAVRLKGVPTVAASKPNGFPLVRYSVQKGDGTDTLPLNVVHSGDVADPAQDFVIFARFTFRLSSNYAP